MKCIYCNSTGTKVIDKRNINDVARRRRECLKCNKRFTTYEKPESLDISVIKKDGKREPYQREKLTKGIKIACQKRAVSPERVERIVTDIENRVKGRKSKEIRSNVIGEIVMRKLRMIDKVAYIRFASVYRSFEDIKEFEKEVKALKR